MKRCYVCVNMNTGACIMKLFQEFYKILRVIIDDYNGNNNAFAVVK